MRTVTFTADKQEEMFYIYSDLWGFYLCGTNAKRVISSVVPLAQHLFYKNENTCMVPLSGSEFPHALLTKPSISINFGEVKKLKAPKIPQNGWWWQHEDTKKSFYVPCLPGDLVDPVIFAKIRADREKDMTGQQL